MCGRTRAGVRPEAVAEATGCAFDEWVDRERYNPKENAAPGSILPVAFVDGRRRQGGAAGGPAAGGPGEKEAAAGAEAHGDDGGLGAPLERKARRRLRSMRWGLAPWFSKAAPDGSGRPAGSPYDHFNSRAERVREQPLTRRLFNGLGPGGTKGGGGKEAGGAGATQPPSPSPSPSPSPGPAPGHRRGVAIVQGFYEWKGEGAGSKGSRKQPYYVQLRGGAPMRLAVVWDTWSGGGGASGGGGGGGGGESESESDGGVAGGGGGRGAEASPLPLLLPLPLHSFSIITVDASRELRWLHDRQPAILADGAAVDAWLGADADAAERALASVGGGGGRDGKDGRGGDGGGSVFEWWPVTGDMNAPSYAGRDAAADVRKKKGTITSFFAASPSPTKHKREDGADEGRGEGVADGGGGRAGKKAKT